MNQNEEMEIDLLQLFWALWDKLWLLILTGIIGFVLFLSFTLLFIKPTYDSTTKIYVLNRQYEDSNIVTSSDLSSSAMLTQDYIELVKTRPVLEGVKDKFNLEDYPDIKVSASSNGRIIAITATHTDPTMAQKIANETREQVAKQITKVMNVEAVNCVEEADFPEHKARPSNLKNGLIGGFLFSGITAAIIILITILDDRVKVAADVEHYLGLSVLGSIPLDDST
ncbi:MAG: protein-tyrosine kinase, partial [Erysipelotrichaceae bacterium]|nr:protein-tyrosine kinase [Erysipelotrichaceae bacterium]